MKKSVFFSFILALCALVATPASAQMEKSKNMVAQEMVGDVTGLAQKWVSLLEAMPEDNLDWRPMKGVRSIRELFTHIGDANYFFMTLVGMKEPEGRVLPKDKTERENRFKTKAEILANLKGSYDFTKMHVAMMSEKIMNTEIDMFGNMRTGRAAMMFNLGHQHEHLGQAIAYARVNGVVPPWSQGN